MDASLERLVRSRARDVCEYCRIPAAAYDQPFHIDHIISRKHRGQTIAENLALSCLDCNLYKGTDIGGLDNVTGQLTRLFHPRLDRWQEHFAWNGPVLTGLTDIGRVTIALLRINQLVRVKARAELIAEGLFPP